MRPAWDHSPNVNGLDFLILVLVALAAFTGFRRGALLQLFSYAGLILGVLAGYAATMTIGSGSLASAVT